MMKAKSEKTEQQGVRGRGKEGNKVFEAREKVDSTEKGSAKERVTRARRGVKLRQQKTTRMDPNG